MKLFRLSLNFAKTNYTSLLGKILLHTLLWGLFIYLSLPDRTFETGYNQNVLNDIFFYTVQVLLFYANSHYWLPRVFNRKQRKGWHFLKVMMYQVTVLTVLILLLSLIFGNLRIVFTGRHADWMLIPLNLGAFIRPYLLYWPFSVGYYYFINHKLVSGENFQLKREVILERQGWLKAELDPHFINNCYHLLDGLLLIDTKKVEEALFTINKIMQYYLLVPKDGLIKMEEELKQCAALIELYKLRYEAVFVSVKAAGNIDHLRIIPMSLVLLLENILRYGVLTDHDEPAEVDISLEEGQMRVTTFNKIRASRPIERVRTGRGLLNLGERLQYFYPNAHHLSINRLNGYFEVCLLIDLNVLK